MLDRHRPLLDGPCLDLGERQPSYSLFFAAMLDRVSADVAWRAGLETQRLNGFHATMRPKHHLHATLWNVEHEVARQPSPQTIASACSLGGRVLMRPFKVGFEAVQDWGRKPGVKAHAVMVGGDMTIGLELLHRQIAEVHGDRSGGLITPHVTLFYGARRFAPRTIEPLTFVVRDFALVLSFVGQTRYEILARFPLTA